MNQVIETIRNRRSIRWYSPELVPRDLLDVILESGNAAPSGAGSRCWRFVVAESAEFRKKLASVARPRYDQWLLTMPEPFRAMRAEIDKVNPDPAYYSAPAIVFVIGWGDTSLFDCPMVCQNMMLAARSLSIGSCWVYIGSLVLKDPEIRAALELKDTERVYGPIILGYPAQGFPQNPEHRGPAVKWL